MFVRQRDLWRETKTEGDKEKERETQRPKNRKEQFQRGAGEFGEHERKSDR